VPLRVQCGVHRLPQRGRCGVTPEFLAPPRDVEGERDLLLLAARAVMRTWSTYTRASTVLGSAAEACRVDSAVRDLGLLVSALGVEP
jgi:hypothetical protein